MAAAVGFQCPQCVRTHTRASRQNQGAYGGQVVANPRTTSIVLIVINAIVWGLLQVAGYVGIQGRLVDLLGLMPRGMCQADPGRFYPDVDEAACQSLGTWVPGVADGSWWQLFTSIFTHVSIFHILCNCLTLFFLGPPLEARLGRARFLVTYLVAGLAGSLAVYWLSLPYSLSYGASGSVFGLLGALLVLSWREKSDIRQLLMWLGLNVLITFTSANISWQGHLGGLVGGAVLACIWAFVGGNSRGRTQWLLVGLVVVAIGVGVAGRTMMLV